MDGAVSVFKVLSHPLRIEVLQLLSEEGLRYTDILDELGVETGNLNFHLRKLDGYVESRDSIYYLTERGVRALAALDQAESVAAAVPTIWMSPSIEASPLQRLKALSIDATLFVGTPLVVSLLVLLSIPIQLSASDPLLYLMAGLNPGEHLLTGSVLLLVASTVGEAYSGRTPGKSVVGIKVVRGDVAPGLAASLVRNVCTVYLLPLDFLLARATGRDELRITDDLLDIRVIEDEGDAGAEGGTAGYLDRAKLPVATPDVDIA